MKNKIEYEFVMQLIGMHSLVMRLLGYSKFDLRENSKIREKLFRRAYELTRQIQG